jgi:hypothetical protein
MREIAHSLAERAVRVAKEARYQSDISLAAAHADLDLAIRRPDEQRLTWARNLWANVKEDDQLTRPQVYARETLALADYPSSLRIPMQAFRIGNLGLAAIPCEVFAETGLAIKQNSALKPSFTIELANGYFGYLPSAEQHKSGGYETWPARSSCLETEAETKIRAEAIRRLESVSQT